MSRDASQGIAGSGTEREPCPVCSAPSASWGRKTTEYGTFTLDRCLKCRFAYVNPRPPKKELVRIYETRGQIMKSSVEDAIARENRYPNSSLDADRMVRRVAQLTPPPGRLLDVGCGCGYVSRAAIRAGYDVEALDVGDFERRCTLQVAGIKILEVSFEDYHCASGSLDVIVMSQILEHVSDINLWMRRAHVALKPGGIIVVALPNFDSAFRRVLRTRDPYITPPIHLNHFNPANLAMLLQRHGFEVSGVEQVSRLPKDIVSKRLPSRLPIRPAVEMVTAAATAVLEALMNTARMGVMINLYATRK